MNTVDPGYWEKRDCLRTPIPELFEAVFILDKAACAHLAGQHERAAALIASTNTDVIRDYGESLWGDKDKYPDKKHFLRYRDVDSLPEPITGAKAPKAGLILKQELIKRDGYICRYCGAPVIHEEALKLLHAAYPDALPWGRKNDQQHAAFQALKLECARVIPPRYGGETVLENMVVSCSVCNCAKWGYHLDELGLTDPRLRAPEASSWDGLMRVIN